MSIRSFFSRLFRRRERIVPISVRVTPDDEAREILERRRAELQYEPTTGFHANRVQQRLDGKASRAELIINRALRGTR